MNTGTVIIDPGSALVAIHLSRFRGIDHSYRLPVEREMGGLSIAIIY